MKARLGVERHLGQVCLTPNGVLHLPEPSTKRKTVLKVRYLKEASLSGSKGAFVSWCMTKERFQVGMPL